MKGVDISHYQKGLTILQIKDAGNEFAIIKVTEGTYLKDAAAFDFYREAYEMGFPVGCYCYSHATTAEDVANEAHFLIDTLNGFPMPCGVFLDIEEPKMLGLPKEKLMAIISTWCNTIYQAGYIPGVYSSEGTLWAKISPDEVGDGCLVWIAKWSQTPPDMPCDLWQDSDSGNIDDVTVDTDQVRGDRFRKLVEVGFDLPRDGFAEDINVHSNDVTDTNVGDRPDISGALAMLAGYIQTPEFRENFLNYIEGRKEK